MHQAMRSMIGVGALLALAVSAAVAQTTTPAPQPGPPSTTAVAPQGLFPAPVGHRQPRPSDLPPDIVKKENHPGGEAGSAMRDFDTKMQICKGC